MNLIQNLFGKTLLILGALAIALITLSPMPVLADTESPHWSYGGQANPTQWGKLSPEFATCEIGQNQSPINITAPVKGQPIQLAFHYNDSPLEIVNNGHTIQVNYAEGSTVEINGEPYALVQFHFHTPSEHTIERQAYALELHLVHRNTAGKLAVVGILIEAGEANPLISQIWQKIPDTGKTKRLSNITINASALLPDQKAYFSYLGSLTTPPCSESVQWHILTKPITASEAQIERFAKLYPVDARPIQPTHNRVIELHDQPRNQK